ncbi:MAG: CYTH domain-containing protein [Clostridiaceae bacterium]|nr:CYTH domain-containing protein [Clostridiaceae bacterium]
MAREIERKFLVLNDDFKKGTNGILYRQGYLCADPKRTVRVRTVGNTGYLTIKGASKGAARTEFEYSIPKEDAEELLLLCETPLIEKYRYFISYKGYTWEVDEFLGENKGLVIAEIELESETQEIELPPWVGAEVTSDPRYYNSSLARFPFSRW